MEKAPFASAVTVFLPPLTVMVAPAIDDLFVSSEIFPVMVRSWAKARNEHARKNKHNNGVFFIMCSFLVSINKCYRLALCNNSFNYLLIGLTRERHLLLLVVQTL